LIRAQRNAALKSLTKRAKSLGVRPSSRSTSGETTLATARRHIAEEFCRCIGYDGRHSVAHQGLTGLLKRNRRVSNGLSCGNSKLFGDACLGYRLRTAQVVDLAGMAIRCQRRYPARRRN
jgi:hypothetical protein